MENNPLISVILPVYDSEKYLRECLNSLRLQTYENLEFICVNDGSKDSSLDILQEFKEKDERFVIINQENSGVSSARNIGIRNANGEFISFIDADDRVSLSLYKKFADLKDKPDIYIFNAVQYDKTTEEIFPIYFFNVSVWNNYRDVDTALSFNDCKNPFHGNLSVCNKIYRKEFLQDFTFLEGRIFEDQYFFFQTMFEAKSIKINPDALYYYRQNADNTMGENAFDIFLIADKLENLIELKGLTESYKYALFQYKYKQFAHVFFKTNALYRSKFYTEMRSRLEKYENSDLSKQICERLTHIGVYKNILKLSCDEFYEKYKDKI